MSGTRPSKRSGLGSPGSPVSPVSPGSSFLLGQRQTAKWSPLEAATEGQDYSSVIQSLLVDLGRCCDSLIAENRSLAQENRLPQLPVESKHREALEDETLLMERHLYEEANDDVLQEMTGKRDEEELGTNRNKKPSVVFHENKSGLDSMDSEGTQIVMDSHHHSEDDAVPQLHLDDERLREPEISHMQSRSSQSFLMLPKWFDHTSSTKAGAQSGYLPSSLSQEDYALDLQKPMCVLNPYGVTRLTWDVCWCLLLIFEIWATPIQLVFVKEGFLPMWWKILLQISFSFFCGDILLNFFTGYIEDDIYVYDHRLIAKHYLKFWFWFDVLATLPWDLMVGAEDGLLSTTAVAKGLKTMRMVKLVRAAKLVRHIKTAGRVNQNISMEDVKIRRKRQQHSSTWSLIQVIYSGLIQIATNVHVKFAVNLMCCIGFLSHIHAIVWAALQQHWSPTPDIPEAFHRYFESFWWAFCTFTFGESHRATEPVLWCLDILIMFERMMLIIAWVGPHVVVKAIIEQEADSQFSLKSREALKYLENHHISLKTELVVLKHFNDTGKHRKRQRWFSELMRRNLPQELQCRVHEELWSPKLASLGLIAHMSKFHSAFLSQLAQVVVEDTYAIDMMICKDGDVARSAYHIISGELFVVTEEPVPPFTSGMWIGEKALVNPDLRRSGSIFSKTASTLLTVPAQKYFALLAELGIEEEFTDFCSKEIWKGLCGRCGSVGDHWSDKCPYFTSSAKRSRQTNKVGNLVADIGRLLQDDQNPKGTTANDLKAFLAYHGLTRIQIPLRDAGICSLQELEDKFSEVQDQIPLMELHVSVKEMDLLTPAGVRSFRNKISSKTRMILTKRRHTATEREHYIFLSHYKVEAGTEAALMRSELESLILEDEDHPARGLKSPIYLDSEDLVDLHDLMKEVALSHNIVLMLTKGILTRPWCLIEVACAFRHRVTVVPVNILKKGVEFEFPDDNFYERLMNGQILGRSGIELIKQHGFEMDEVCYSLKETFKRIAVPYSPHRPAAIRKAELQALLKQVFVRGASEVQPKGVVHVLSSSEENVAEEAKAAGSTDVLAFGI